MFARKLTLVWMLSSLSGLAAQEGDSWRQSDTQRYEFHQNERIAFVGNSLAERMNLFGYLEAAMHLRYPDKHLVIRNFGWPADEVGKQQRPDNYTDLDDPLTVFDPDLFVCFFGFNEHFEGDDLNSLASFAEHYLRWIREMQRRFDRADRPVRFILVSPIACEPTDNPHLPGAASRNKILSTYTNQIQRLAESAGWSFVDLFHSFDAIFRHQSSSRYTINGIHLNESGYALVASAFDQQLFGSSTLLDTSSPYFQRILNVVNDKSWYHMQDYRMLNGWYVYGGRRTWDTETFPLEYRKIRKMVAVRDQYLWDLVNGIVVADVPDDSRTGEVLIPDTMFGTRDDQFRKYREPTTLQYPTPEESIQQMEVPAGFQVRLFASEREFPELSNPAQMTFDSRGRLWVACMTNYPQWLPGAAKPGDKLLILEDLDGDGQADTCKTFYDRLICPTGFEFFRDGVLVVDEPRIIFLRDTDGDDVADDVSHWFDGIATDDTHHAMSAWEWSHGGLLYMLEGISMSTTLETPWGPFRNKGPSGVYVFDPLAWRVRHFKTPGYGNPWCLVFNRWGMGIVGDGTNAQQHWTSPLSGFPVESRKTLRPIFDNHDLRPAVGSEFLYSRHLPDEMQGQFIYGCVINMHGLPRFVVQDEPETAGYMGQRLQDLIRSTDNFFRPVDPQIGPDGALWFGDWCNAIIGHMQYSQRDPNRDHEHGRIYRLVHTQRPLLEPELQAEKSVEQLLDQLTAHELRTRYRARRELRARDAEAVLNAVDVWIHADATDEQLCEALWLQESFRKLDPGLIERMMRSDNFQTRAAAVHAVTHELARFPTTGRVFQQAVADPHPRVRLEGVRGLSFLPSVESLEWALLVLQQPMDYWLEYTLEHTLQALSPQIPMDSDGNPVLSNSNEQARDYLRQFVLAAVPGGRAIRPLKIAQNSELSRQEREKAIDQLARLKGGQVANGAVVFQRLCSACHQLQDAGKAFGPALDGVGARYEKAELIKHTLWPNESIAEGFETVRVLTVDGRLLNGFVLKEDGTTLSLGVATDDGKGEQVDLPLDEIEERREMKSSSMPGGLVGTIAPIEFLDLIEFLANQYADKDQWIFTARHSEQPLRQAGPWIEISRNAQIQIDPNFPPQWNRYVTLTLSGAGADEREFAFHSPEPPTNPPSVLVRLRQRADIRQIQLQNRRSEQFYHRADGITIWISDEGQHWRRVWQAAEPAADYQAIFPEGILGQYLKIGLERPGILHLNQIVVFGPAQATDGRND